MNAADSMLILCGSYADPMLLIAAASWKNIASSEC
jgi:hypothetical protein